MKLIISDLNQNQIKSITSFTDNDIVITPNQAFFNCLGCFSCWIKTPGQCIINDDLPKMGQLINQTDEVIIISQCYYGSLSPFVKKVIDRSIDFVLPYFSIVENEVHHKKRYDKTPPFTYYIYHQNQENYQSTFNKLAHAMSLNWHIKNYQINYIEEIKSC